MTNSDEFILSGILLKLRMHLWVDPDNVEHRFMTDEPYDDGNRPLFLTDLTTKNTVKTIYTIVVKDGQVFITFLNIKYKLLSIDETMKLENEIGRVITYVQSN